MTPSAQNRGIASIALMMILGCDTVLAAPLGFYIGAGFGHSQVHNNLYFGDLGVGYPGPYNVSRGTTGWKLMVGIRPLSFVGAELAFIDFGSVNGNGVASISATPDRGGVTVTPTSYPKAAALYAVGYLPIPIPHLDVFAKAGVARLNSHVGATGQVTCGFVNALFCSTMPVPLYSASRNSTEPAYGLGAQLKFENLAVRGEYERIAAGSGDADLLSLGVTYDF
jgi:opacity protein-like surface antigen